MTKARTKRTKIAAAGLACLALAAAGAAHASEGSIMSNYTFPDGSKGFAFQALNGVGNPGVIVGFNPQPDPPGVPPTVLIPGNPISPTLFNPVVGQPFSLEFSITGFGDGSVTPPPAPNADGVTGFEQVIGGHVFDVGFSFGPGPVNPGSWVGFNPQPDPPGFGFGVGFAFFGAADPWASFHVTEDGTLLNFTLSSAPEPSTWLMLAGGIGLLGATLRRRGVLARA